MFSCNQARIENKDESLKETQDTIQEMKKESLSQEKSVLKVSAADLAPFFKKQISGTQTLIQPKEVSQKTDGIYCYFRMKGAKATGFRFHIQFWSEKYANVDSYTFNSDGQIFSYIANHNNSGSGDSRIVQSSTFFWYDNAVNKTDLKFLEAIANGTNVTVSLIDRGTNETINTLIISDNEKASIRRTIDYYHALDGALIPKKGMVNIRQ